MGKSVAGDSCNMVADGDRSEMRALGEDHAADGDDAVGDGDGYEGATLVEGLIADVGNAVRDSDGGEVGATIEGSGADVGDAVGDCDISEAGAFVEGLVADGGDGIVTEADSGWDGDGTAGAAVAGDDGLVTADGVGVVAVGVGEHAKGKEQREMCEHESVEARWAGQTSDAGCGSNHGRPFGESTRVRNVGYDRIRGEEIARAMRALKSVSHCVQREIKVQWNCNRGSASVGVCGCLLM